MATCSKSLIAYGDTPNFMLGRTLLHDLTQSTEVIDYNTAKERLKFTQKFKYYPVEFFGACVCVLQELYKFFPVEVVLDIIEATQKWLYKIEKKRRDNPNAETPVISFLGANLSLKFEVDLRALYKKQYNTKNPSSKDMRKYVAMFREIANTPIEFRAETTQKGDTLTTSIKEPLLYFAPLPIETEGGKLTNKRGDKPYKVLLEVNAMAVYRVVDVFSKFPLDLPTRLSTANTDNPIYKALIFPLLEMRSSREKNIKTYLTAKARGKKDLPTYPFNCDFYISQIFDLLKFQGLNVRANRLETYIIRACDAFRDKIKIIYKYEIIKNPQGEIIKVRFVFNSQFYKGIEATSNDNEIENTAQNVPMMQTGARV